MAQKNRKTGKKRGSRSCGYGSCQKHRGSGSRGGRGNAGSGKHKQIKSRLKGRVFGKSGFKRHPSLKREKRTINLSEINGRIGQWSEEGRVKKASGKLTLDLSELGYDKVLGGGKLTRKVRIKAESFSESAKKKIGEAGGEALESNDVDTV